jgi:hypothetical protein
VVALAAAACGKGPRPMDSTPPSRGGGTAEVEPLHHSLALTELEDGGGSPVEPPATDEEALYIDGVRLRLQPSGCTLTAAFLDEERKHAFQEFPGACHFACDLQGQPWVVPTDHGKAVLVESSAPAEEGDCDTALQIVVITERGPELSREVQHVSACGPGPWDELMYHVLASDRVDLGTALSAG